MKAIQFLPPHTFKRLTGNGLIGCIFIFIAMIVTELPDMKQIKWPNINKNT